MDMKYMQISQKRLRRSVVFVGTMLSSTLLAQVSDAQSLDRKSTLAQIDDLKTAIKKVDAQTGAGEKAKRAATKVFDAHSLAGVLTHVRKLRYQNNFAHVYSNG